MNKISWLILLLVVLVVPLSLGQVESFGTFKQNTNIQLIQTYNATYCNITSITAPNSTIYPPVLMTKNGQRFNYTFTDSSQLGSYSICGDCDTTSWCGSMEITYNGSDNPEGIVVVFFCICFLVVIFFLSYLFIYNIGHFAQMDYDLGDLIKNVSAYFVLVGLYFLSTFYMGNEMIDVIIVWIIGIIGFTNVGMSFLFFIICFLTKRKIRIENAW